MYILDRCTSSGFCLGNRDGLNLDVRCCLVQMNVEADDVLSSPTVTCPMIGVQCPIFDTLFEYDMGITSLKRKVHILVTEGESCQYPMVATNDNADGAVRTIVRISKRIIFVLVWFEAKLVKTFL